MYLLWARTRDFWPFVDATYDAKFEDQIDDNFVHYDDYDHELKALRKKVEATEYHMKELREETKGVRKQLDSKNDELRDVCMQLGTQEFMMCTYYRKLQSQEELIDQLLHDLTREESTLQGLTNENVEIGKKILCIQNTYGHTGSKDIIHEVHRNPMSNAIATLPVQEWGVEEVYFWWRTALPRAAQRHIELVKQCELTGIDLLAVDEQMLEQFGMMKILVHQVLKNIDQLRTTSYYMIQEDKPQLTRRASSRRARSKSRDRNADTRI